MKEKRFDLKVGIKGLPCCVRIKEVDKKRISFKELMSRACKITRTRTKPRTKKKTRNASLSLIQDWKHKDIRQKHNIC
jgi:hypothetical protein